MTDTAETKKPASPPATSQQDVVTPFTVTPIEKPFVTAAYYGDSGGSTQYWYWVQAVYAMGFGPLSTSVASVTVLSLSHSNVVSVNWTPCTSAMYYNVWRTTTSSAPTAGTGQCIATGLATADGLVDNNLPTFTIAVGTPPALLDAKKASDEAKKANDDLIKELEETQKKADEKAAEDSAQATKLNRIYNERFSLPVRETDAQKKASDSGTKDSKEKAEAPSPKHEEAGHVRK